MFQKTTDRKLEAARATLATAQDRLAQFEGERTVALVGDDGDALTRIGAGIAHQRQIIADTADRIAALEAQQRAEHAAQRQRDYVAQVDRIEASLLQRAAAAAKAEQAISALGIAVREFETASRDVLRAWPPAVPRFFTDFYLGVDRLGDQIRECLTPYSHLSCRKPARAYVDEAAKASDRVTGFAATERGHHADLIADLRERGAPEPPAAEPEQQEGVAA